MISIGLQNLFSCFYFSFLFPLDGILRQALEKQKDRFLVSSKRTKTLRRVMQSYWRRCFFAGSVYGNKSMRAGEKEALEISLLFEVNNGYSLHCYGLKQENPSFDEDGF